MWMTSGNMKKCDMRCLEDILPKPSCYLLGHGELGLDKKYRLKDTLNTTLVETVW